MSKVQNSSISVNPEEELFAEPEEDWDGWIDGMMEGRWEEEEQREKLAQKRATRLFDFIAEEWRIYEADNAERYGEQEIFVAHWVMADTLAGYSQGKSTPDENLWYLAWIGASRMVEAFAQTGPDDFAAWQKLLHDKSYVHGKPWWRHLVERDGMWGYIPR